MISEDQKIISDKCIGRRYKRTEYHKKILSDVAKKYGFKPPSQKDSKWSEERRIRTKIAMKGKNIWSKGRKLSKEHIEAISKSLKGKKKSPEHIEKVRAFHLGAKRSLESRIRISIAHRKHTNGNWLNGKSDEKYPVEFNTKLKERIRNRDKHICQYCGKLQSECKKRLDIHHIDYDKQNLKDDNFISLCKPCHALTLKNRSWWLKFYKEMRPQCLRNNKLLLEKLTSAEPIVPLSLDYLAGARN